MPKPEGALHVKLGDELLAAARDRADTENTTVADVIRRALAKFVGRLDLDDAVRRGRPRKSPPRKS
jgi:hypothetical protein